jgi:hypothetical protein
MGDEYAANIRISDVVFPPPTIPTVYADSIMNLAPSPHVIKFYLGRIDPSTKGDANYISQPIMQVVMSLTGFVNAAVFFEKALQEFRKRGLVTDDEIAAARLPLEGK